MRYCANCGKLKGEHDFRRILKDKPTEHFYECKACRVAELAKALPPEGEERDEGVKTPPSQINRMEGLYTPPAWSIRKGSDAHLQIRSRGL